MGGPHLGGPPGSCSEGQWGWAIPSERPDCKAPGSWGPRAPPWFARSLGDSTKPACLCACGPLAGCPIHQHPAALSATRDQEPPGPRAAHRFRSGSGGGGLPSAKGTCAGQLEGGWDTVASFQGVWGPHLNTEAGHGPPDCGGHCPSQGEAAGACSMSGEMGLGTRADLFPHTERVHTHPHDLATRISSQTLSE